MNKKGIILSIITITIIIVSFLVSESIATFFFSCLFFIFGYLYTKSVPKSVRNQSVILFNIIFSLLTIFALIHYLDTQVDYNNFAQDWRDEYKFWTRSQGLAAQYSWIGVFQEAFGARYLKNQAYYLYIGSLGYWANTYFDGNHLFLQFMGSVFWGSLIPVTLYKLFLLFFNKEKAFKRVLLFSLFTVLFSYSFQLMRDVIIAFFYTLIIYIILKKYSAKGLIQLLLITVVVWFLRFQHGVFCMLFILYYLYNQYKKNKIGLTFIFIGAFSIGLIYFYDAFVMGFSSLDRFGTRMEENVAGDQDSLAKSLFQLPPIIKQLTVLFYTQIRPFPSWNSLKNSSNLYEALINILPIFYSLFWYIIAFSIIKWIIFRKAIRRLSNKIKLLLLLVFMFLIANTVAAVDLRRIMCVYPFIYLVYYLIKEKDSKVTGNVINYKFRNKVTNLQAISSYLIFVFIYLFIKGW